MQLVTSELLNPCCFTHSVTKDIELQSLIVLTIIIFYFFYNNEFHVIINFDRTCKMHAI
jgi:hypothetical protein